jgi:hypothetical protein
MKLKILLLAFLTASAALAADSAPLFNALLTMGKEQRFVLATEDAKTSGWLKLGDNFAGYTLKSYDAAATTLVLEREGKSIKVVLVNGVGVKDAPAPTAATLADAEEVFRVMRFDEMMGKLLDSQKKAIAPMLQQQQAAIAARMNLTPEEKDAFLALQKKGLDDMMASAMGPEMRADMAKAYSEVFSKEELSGLTAFYSTPTGQALIDKTPEVSAKMQTLMMPRIQQGALQLQQATRDFAVDIKAKHAAAAAAAPVTVPLPAEPAKP